MVIMKENLIRKTIDNNGTRIEYYVNNEANNKPTLVISMGVWEPASRAFPLITRLSDIHCIVLSYRGRGGSDTPETGYDWGNHTSDLASALQHEKVNNPIFLGFSKGVSYMLGYLSLNPQMAKGIIIIDYPAMHIKSEKGYAQLWSNMLYNGFNLSDHISPQALYGIEHEATPKEFYEDLHHMKCPIWVFRGTDSESYIPSNLTDEDILNYKTYVKNLEVVDFNYSGHMILDEELGKACNYIKSILENIL
jgi:pimeloyl-ACP methyl ester carboxylesterase